MDAGKGNMMGEWRRRTWGAGGGEGERGPVSDKGRYDQVITSDRMEEEEERTGQVECWGRQKRAGTPAVRGPLCSIRERQRRRDSQPGIRCTRGKFGGRSLTSGNISESDFNGNDESFRGSSTM